MYPLVFSPADRCCIDAQVSKTESGCKDSCKMAKVPNKWSRKEVSMAVSFLWAENTEPVNIHRRFCLCGEKVMSVQQVQKLCRGFVDSRTNVKDEEQSGRPSTLKTVVYGIDEMVWKEIRVMLSWRCILIFHLSLCGMLSMDIDY
ncbi:hypothetical protein PR048_004931 [Dryococelus australis]|uniref:Uncharacterized protein n=1 Tax=Dryococelus australis TaxID=614101 RepID=A0ABQ9I6T4_9NEOP|nr:hypothetical protein PR048_004931 [Dryococelus australis]